MRRQAALALGEIGPAARGSIQALTAALKDDDDDVIENAAEALEKIKAADKPGGQSSLLKSAMSGRPTIIEPRGIKTHQGSLFDRAAGANFQFEAGGVGMEQSK